MNLFVGPAPKKVAEDSMSDSKFQFLRVGKNSVEAKEQNQQQLDMEKLALTKLIWPEFPEEAWC